LENLPIDVGSTWHGLKYTFPQHNLQKHYIYHYLEHHSFCPQQRHLQPGQGIKTSEIGKWLSMFFGLPFLPPDQVADAFAEDKMSDVSDSVNSPPPKPEVILTNFFAEPTVLFVPITSRDYTVLAIL
jgi:hypothetical protein